MKPCLSESLRRFRKGTGKEELCPPDQRFRIRACGRAHKHTHTCTHVHAHSHTRSHSLVPENNVSPLRICYKRTPERLNTGRRARRNGSSSQHNTCLEMPFPLHRGVQVPAISFIATLKLPIKMDPLWLTLEPAGCLRSSSPHI